MPFYKKTEVRDAKEKYGFEHKGVFALEPVKKGEPIFECDLSICDYLPLESCSAGRTRDETLEYFKKYPEQKDFIHKYMYMVGDDLFDWPKNFVDQIVHEDCMFFNHRYISVVIFLNFHIIKIIFSTLIINNFSSCDPNCGFQALDSSLVVAIRDIEVGEELCYDYQCKN
jgi:SET domain-containing protein